MRSWISLLILATVLFSYQRVTLNGDWITAMQLYNGLLIGASPDWTPVPDVPCLVTYNPIQGIKETCYPNLLPNGGTIEDLRVIGNTLYASARGDTSWGRLDAVYLLKYDRGFKIIAKLSKERWGSPYIQNTLTLMAPVKGNKIAMLVELLDSWGSDSIRDIRLVLLDADGNIIKDVSISNVMNTNVDHLFYNIAGNGKYVLLVQAWKDNGIRYRVVRINVDTMNEDIIADKSVSAAYTLAVSRLYPVRGNGEEYVAVYYLLNNGTFVFKAFGPKGLIFSFSRSIPLDIMNAESYGCCKPKVRIITSFLAYDEGFYVPISLLVNSVRGPAWIELLLGIRGAYAFDARKESWGFSLARVKEWGSLVVSGCDACGEGYAYALPDPGGAITFEKERSCPVVTVTKTVTVTERVCERSIKHFITKSFEELERIYEEVSKSTGFKAIILKAPFQRNVLYLSTLERFNDLYNKLLAFDNDLSSVIQRLQEITNGKPTFNNIYKMMGLVQRAKVDIVMKANTLKEMGHLIEEIRGSMPAVSCNPNKARKIILGILSANTIKEVVRYREEASKMGGMDAVVKCLIKNTMMNVIKKYEEVKAKVDSELRLYESEVKEYEAMLKYLSVR